jgi:formiminotetrahydrofolate cyclodeaminase
VEFIRREAQRYGISIVSTEIVGLVPQEALNMAADYYLQLERFSEDQILERKIEKAQDESRKHSWTLDSFLDELSSPNPTPGGGSVGALAGTLAASLGVMVSDITLSKEKFKEAHPAIRSQAVILTELRKELLLLIREDATADEQVVSAYKLPKGSAEEKSERKAAIDRALRQASEVPLRTARLALRGLDSLQAIQALINPNAISDLGVGAQMALAAGKSGLYNVRVNLISLPDDEYRKSRTIEAEQLWNRLEERASKIQEYVLSRIC